MPQTPAPPRAHLPGSHIHRHTIVPGAAAVGGRLYHQPHAWGAGCDRDVTWEKLRARVSRYASELRLPLPAGATCCVVCRGPAGPGYARCFQCRTHEQDAPGMLADAVVPVSYAVKGGRHAADLWLYKSDMAGATTARASLQALLLVFLRDHARCVWRHAVMPPPTRVAAVPSGQGRPGTHPLLGLFSPYLVLPQLVVAVRPGEPPGRALNPRRFTVGRGVAGESVLLLDDTWVSGASAQSAAVALRMAGARHVAVVVLGRHVNPADPRACRLTSALEAAPFDPRVCAVHGAWARPGVPPVHGARGIKGI
jgi:hypothetical protein